VCIYIYIYIYKHTNVIHHPKLRQNTKAETHTNEERRRMERACVTHYNVIIDACKCTLLISQYRRCALETLISHHVEKLRRAICVLHWTIV
jgi:hypothetical protein